MNSNQLAKLNFGSKLNHFWRLDPRRIFVQNLPQKAKLLDFGCGNGDVLKRFRELRPDIIITGVDILDYSADVVKHGCEFIKIEKIDDICDFGSEAFDAVTCIHVLEHLDTFSYTHFTSCLSYVLKINGRLYLETPHSKSIYFPSLSFFSTDGGPINFFDDPTHIRPSTEASLRTLLSRHFHVEKTCCYRNWVFLLMSPLFFLLGFISRRLLVLGIHHFFGWSVYATCKKVK